MSGRPRWPDADELELVRLNAEGQSKSQMAKALTATQGRVFTRSSVGSKCYRLGLTRPGGRQVYHGHGSRKLIDWETGRADKVLRRFD
jgi:hypothetical protein